MKSRTVCILCLWTALTVRPDTVGKPPAPAQVSNSVAESDLTRITLTPEAVNRLGIVTKAVQIQAVRRTRLLGGEVILPAQFAGDASKDSVASPGALLQATTPPELLRLAQAQIDADTQVEQAHVTAALADKALVRARQMLQDKAGSARVVDEAQAQFDSSAAGLTAAQTRRALLGPDISDAGRLSRLWIRTPVYVGDLGQLDVSAEVAVNQISGDAAHPTVTAKPVPAFPSANAGAATVDLFYEMESTNGWFRLGQRVGVMIPSGGPRECRVVPWSSVVHDVSGGTWVYEQTGPHTYVRRRVQVSRIDDGNAELSHGPERGTPIVTEGVAELFGTEFGVGK